MSYLAHFEFGIDHKPFDFSAKTNTHNKESLEYWIEHWLNTYNYLLQNKYHKNKN